MEHYIEKLKSKGFKLTPRRHAIIKLFFECCGHMTPEDVFEKLKKNFKNAEFPEYTRNLESLVECGILTRIQQFDRKKALRTVSLRA
jgi:Fe2+ or Zn2+ uptake regulation protein